MSPLASGARRQLALNELAYIDGLRRRRPRTSVELQTPDQRQGKDH